MTIIPPPTDAQFGHVVGTFLLAHGDTAGDADRMPDYVPATGTVKFSPATAKHISTGPSAATIVKQPVTGKLIGGVLHDPADAPGVWLIAGVYTVDFYLESASLTRTTIEVTTAHTLESPLDLTLHLPTPADPTVKWVVNEQVYLDTLAARDEALAVVEGVEATISDAIDTQVPAAVGAAVTAADIPATVDTAAGTAVAAHISLYGELYNSGDRNISSLLLLSSGVVILRVKMGWAHLEFADVRLASSGTVILTESGLGSVAPSRTVRRGMVMTFPGGLLRRVDVHSDGKLRVHQVVADEILSGTVIWPFDRTPPSTPPGSPA